MAPCFFTQPDMQAGAAEEDVLLWGMTTWIDGKENVLPSSVPNFGSFDVLDALVAYYMDTGTFPNLNVSFYPSGFSLLRTICRLSS